jgi:thioredoxin reductase
MTAMAAAALTIPHPLAAHSKPQSMTRKDSFDAIIIGGSYSGLATAMALGRALRKVLVIDSGKPCNGQTPHSHNFLTQDGQAPAAIVALARHQVEQYDAISFYDGWATKGRSAKEGFEIELASGNAFSAHRLVFATGIKDLIPDIPGFSECWGISVLHCPYCHGYEVRNEQTGILANGNHAFELAKLISNWTTDLSIYTNGPSTLTPEQQQQLRSHRIQVIEKQITQLDHAKGYVRHIEFIDGSVAPLKALYAKLPFTQHSGIPQSLGCELSDDGYIRVDVNQETNIKGVYACGDSTNKLRTVAQAVATGTAAGMMLSKQLIMEAF